MHCVNSLEHELAASKIAVGCEPDKSIQWFRKREDFTANSLPLMEFGYKHYFHHDASSAGLANNTLYRVESVLMRLKSNISPKMEGGVDGRHLRHLNCDCSHAP